MDSVPADGRVTNGSIANDRAPLPDDVRIWTEAMQEAVSLAIEKHRRLGQSIVVVQDGEIVEIPPDQIPPYEPKRPFPLDL
jgi:hypothetical protein